MRSSKVSFLFSMALIVVNVLFLFTIVSCQHLVSRVVFPGLTVGILGFIAVITFAVLLTWIYVRYVNRSESK
jgi:uncharacterized membrane protein (DUF485 family)